jgi:hypothetical protein
MQSFYVDKEKENEKMYDSFRMVHGMEVGGMQDPVYARGTFKRQTLANA